MKTIGVKAIRRANLRSLIEINKTQKSFAELAELSVGHVSQMVNGTREMGEDVARRIEKKCLHVAIDYSVAGCYSLTIDKQQREREMAKQNITRVVESRIYASEMGWVGNKEAASQVVDAVAWHFGMTREYAEVLIRTVAATLSENGNESLA